MLILVLGRRTIDLLIERNLIDVRALLSRIKANYGLHVQLEKKVEGKQRLLIETKEEE